MAQKAARMQVLSDGRFRLGMGTGENLNEHVVGKRWPAVGVRNEMLSEAIEVIGALFDGDNVNHRGKHFDVESARLFDRDDTRVPIGVAVSGQQSCALAGRHAHLMVAVEPKPELGEMFDEAGGTGKPRVGQMALCSRSTSRRSSRSRRQGSPRWRSCSSAVRAGGLHPLGAGRTAAALRAL